MIKQVIKRNGEVEDFLPEKINSMAEWATENSKVTWSDIALVALRNLGDRETVTAQEIQQALIKACLDAEDYQHNKVAGRLLIGAIRKEAVCCSNFVDHYYQMVEDGYYRDMNYDDEDLYYLAQIVDANYDLDLTYGYPTLRQFYDKYALKDSNGLLLELPQYMYMAIAMSMFEDDDLDDVILYYEKASKQKINIPSPILKQQRTHNNTGVSCVISTAGDTLHGIEATKHTAFMSTASSAGLGIEYAVRSVKDDVRQGYAQAGGKLPHYRTLEMIVKEVTQAARGGSATVSFRCIDPEVETLLVLKLKRSPESKRIDQLDYSLLMNNDFLRRAAKRQPWALVSRVDLPELWESFSKEDGSFEKWMDYALDETNGVKKKIVNAFDILKEYVDNRLESGRIYRTNLTLANKHTPFNEEIRLSNLCVAPETQILTKEGYVPIAELEGESVDIWNGEEWSNVKVTKTGVNQKLITVTSSSGHSLDCTPYHKFYIANGYGGKILEKRAHELQAGDKLIKFELPVVVGEVELENAYANGFFSADGTTDSNGGKRLYFYHEKRKLVHLFNLKNHRVDENQNREQGLMNHLKEKYFVPTQGYSVQSRLKWLAGWLDGDGCVYRNGDNEQIVGSSVEPEFLRDIQRMLQTLGVSCKISKLMDEGYRLLPKNDGSGDLGEYWCKESERLLITSFDTYRLMELGLGKYLNRLEVNKRKPQRDAKRFFQIASVVDKGRIDDTYCFTEGKRGMGMFNGILTGQCQEVLLPTKPYNHITELYKTHYDEGDGLTAQCFLSAIDAVKIEGDSDYEETAYIVLKSLDNLINNMSYPFPQFEVTGKAYRSVGVGITNLAYFLALRGLDYKTGQKYMHELAERHYYYLCKASVKLAKERGKFDWIDKTKWKNGWTPLDTYCREVDKIVGTSINYDWATISHDIKKYGVRFSTLVAHMPCESSSVFSGGVNSLLPIRDKLVYKSSKKGNIQFFAPNSDALYYQNAYDVPPETLLEGYAIFQKWCDQAISADTYVKKEEGKKVSTVDLIKLQLLSNKLGVKTLYYNNTRTNRGNDATIIEDEPDCENCAL